MTTKQTRGASLSDHSETAINNVTTTTGTAGGRAGCPPQSRSKLTRSMGPSQRFLPYVAIVFLGFLTLGIPLPVLPQQVHATLGFGDITAGWVMGIQSLATLLARPFAGSASDRHGGKPAVLLGLSACSMASLAYLLSAVLSHSWASLGVILAGRLLLGMGESLVITGALAWAIGAVGAPASGRVMVWVGIAMYGALGAGAPAGVTLYGHAGFAGVALAGAVFPAAAIMLAARCSPIRPTGGARLPFSAVLGTIWPAGTALCLATVAFAGLSMFLPLAYLVRGWSGSGLALAGFGSAYVVTRLLCADLPDRLGARPVALASMIVEAVGQAVIWRADTPGMALAGAVLTGLGFSLVFPALGVAVMSRLPPQNRGSGLGGYAAFFDLSLAVTGPLAGFIASRSGLASVFAAGSASAALAMVATLIATTERKR